MPSRVAAAHSEQQCPADSPDGGDRLLDHVPTEEAEQLGSLLAWIGVLGVTFSRHETAGYRAGRPAASPSARPRTAQGSNAARKNSPQVPQASVQFDSSERIGLEQGLQERDVAEIGQQCPVACEHELLGVVGPEPARGHLSLQEGDRSLEHRTQCDTELAGQPATAFERFAPNQADEFRALREEAKTRRQNAVHLLPTVAWPVDCLGYPGQPVRERSFEHLAVQRLFGGEMVQQARTPDSDELCDVIEGGPSEAVLSEAEQRGVEDRLACRHSRLTSQMRGEDSLRIPLAHPARSRLTWTRHFSSLPTRR